MENMAGRRVYRRRRGQKTVLGEREKRRLAQLVTCLLLFCALFCTRGKDRLERFHRELSGVLETSADFQAAAEDLNWALDSGRPIGKTLGQLLTKVFMPKAPVMAVGSPGPLYRTVWQGLGQSGVSSSRWLTSIHSLSVQKDPLSSSGAWEEQGQSMEAATAETEPEVTVMAYDGPPLPDNTTMDRYALHLEETVSPVMAVLSSGFGWREHPIEGEERFHFGVDLASDTGTPVLAYAAGTVDYIGESDVYGQYLQLRHSDGVTSFYAHCSKLCVQQGQTVAAGEKVAESGATGEVTGPHLHFELKKNGVRLNPIYYIQTIT